MGRPGSPAEALVDSHPVSSGQLQGKPRLRGRLRKPIKALPWHPLLFAAWPVLALYNRNAAEIPPRDVLWTLGVTWLAVAAVLVVLALMLRDGRRAALITTVLVFAVLLWGHVRNLLGGAGWLLPAWLVLTAVAVFGAARTRELVGDLTRLLRGVGLAVLILPLFGIAQTVGPAIAAGEVANPLVDYDDQVGSWSAPGKPRDIYYLVFDRYGSELGLRKRFGFNNSAFTGDLERRDFFVAGKTAANHLKTAHSLASSMNLQYLNVLEDAYGQGNPSLLPVYELLQKHQLGRILQTRGYEYVHIGAWWGPTQTNPNADLNLGIERRSDFVQTFWDSTLMSRQAVSGRREAVEHRRRSRYEGSKIQFGQIREAAARSGPTFTLAHILLPHQPFVFDRTGRYVSGPRSRRWRHDRSYLEQLRYTNGQIRALVDDLLDVPEGREPIIIIQADEGPTPRRYLRDARTYNWVTGATLSELREKFRILNAYHLPGVDDTLLYEDISPVNSWRVVFNAYFGADLPLLDDRSYVFRDRGHPYAFTEVSDEVGFR